MSRRSGGCLLAALLAGVASGAGAAVSCHIHPPGSTPERPVGIIGPYPSSSACEQARLHRFGDSGRCHCVADFSPRWVPPADFSLPGQSPMG